MGPGIRLSVVLISFALFGIDAVFARDADPCPLLEALREFYDPDAGIETSALILTPFVKSATAKTIETLQERLEERYRIASLAFDSVKAEKTAHLVCVLVLAGKRAGREDLFERCRGILWADLSDIAGAVTMSLYDKVKQARMKAVMWKPLWRGLFKAVMQAHGRAEGEGNKDAMKLRLEELQIMALAWLFAFKEKDLVEDYVKFKQALEKWKKLEPDRRR
jgi:hypothetical protein